MVKIGGNKVGKGNGAVSKQSDWIKKYNEKGSIEEAFPCKGKLAPCDKEKFKLKKELTRVTRERDILLIHIFIEAVAV
ncbi:hypothetical protein IYZ83_002685 [Wolbachia pipientis]|uniref:hypothetical protein n=1 Tax=Wolbachia pipientis TaxID=955 RepID=UPI001F1837C8|nr:hypothetical protein [Wolbachia pipientis]UIP92106.1 hypothetical protein IYZ83_002685 [Wolbachia pipientis]